MQFSQVRTTEWFRVATSSQQQQKRHRQTNDKMMHTYIRIHTQLRRSHSAECRLLCLIFELTVQYFFLLFSCKTDCYVYDVSIRL